MSGPERRGPERPGPEYPSEWDSEPNDGPGPDGHHVITGECFACMVGVATGPESHGDRCRWSGL